MSLYQVEKRLREENVSPLDRKRARWLEFRKPCGHLSKLIRRLGRFRGITPRSKLGKALDYAANSRPQELDVYRRRGHRLERRDHLHFRRESPPHGADPFGYFEWIFENWCITPHRKISKPCCPPTGSIPARRPVRPSRIALHRCHSRQTSGKNAKGALLTAYINSQKNLVLYKTPKFYLHQYHSPLAHFQSLQLRNQFGFRYVLPKQLIYDIINYQLI